MDSKLSTLAASYRSVPSCPSATESLPIFQNSVRQKRRKSPIKVRTFTDPPYYTEASQELPVEVETQQNANSSTRFLNVNEGLNAEISNAYAQPETYTGISRCYLCRSDLVVSRPNPNSNSAFDAWDESCAKTFCLVLKLDESFKHLLTSAAYCGTCLALVRDLNFLREAIDRFETRLNHSRKRIELLLKNHYRTVIQETAALDPLDDVDVKTYPSDEFAKRVGEALNYGTLAIENNSIPVELITEVGTELYLPNLNPIRRSLRKRRVKVKELSVYRPILPKPTVKYFPEAGSDGENAKDNDADDPDFDPSAHGYPDPDAPSSASRLKALIMRHRKLRKTSCADFGAPGKNRNFKRMKWSCSYAGCKYLSYNLSRYSVHKNTVHGEDVETPHHCQGAGCDKRFASRHYLKRHQELHCPGIPPVKILKKPLLDDATAAARKKILCDADGCRFLTYSKGRYLLHRNRVHQEDPDTPYHCEIEGCAMRFGSALSLKRHQNMNCPGFQPILKPRIKPILDEETLRTRKQIRCDYDGCKFVTHGEHFLRVHRNKVHAEDPATPYHCMLLGCGKRFESQTQLSAHLRRRVCQVGRKNARRPKAKALEHTKAVKKKSNKKPGERRRTNLAAPDPLKCEICAKYFDTVDDVTAHIELHRQREAENVNLAFSCVMPLCYKRFMCSSTLKAHVLKYHEDKGCKCEVCGLVLVSAKHLKYHMQKHGTQAPAFKCPEPDCHYIGMSGSDVRHHSQKHSQLKTYQCATCGKQFRWRSSLTLHMRVHDNYRPYKCSFMNCDKSFTANDKLQTHEESHSTSRNHLCALCPKTYKTTKHLHQHLRLTHKKHEKLKQFCLQKE